MICDIEKTIYTICDNIQGGTEEKPRHLDVTSLVDEAIFTIISMLSARKEWKILEGIIPILYSEFSFINVPLNIPNVLTSCIVNSSMTYQIKPSDA